MYLFVGNIKVGLNKSGLGPTDHLNINKQGSPNKKGEFWKMFSVEIVNLTSLIQL